MGYLNNELLSLGNTKLDTKHPPHVHTNMPHTFSLLHLLSSPLSALRAAGKTQRREVCNWCDKAGNILLFKRQHNNLEARLGKKKSPKPQKKKNKCWVFDSVSQSSCGLSLTRRKTWTTALFCSPGWECIWSGSDIASQALQRMCVLASDGLPWYYMEAW